MTIYNAKIQRQNEIRDSVAGHAEYYQILSRILPSLKDYNAELSRYICSLNLVDCRNFES